MGKRTGPDLTEASHLFSFACGLDTVRVLSVKRLEGLWGYFEDHPDSKGPTVVVAEAPLERKTATILHEMIHAISAAHGLALSERTVRGLELGLTQAARSAPGFFATLSAPAAAKRAATVKRSTTAKRRARRTPRSLKEGLEWCDEKFCEPVFRCR